MEEYNFNNKSYSQVTKTNKVKVIPNPDLTLINKEFLVACEKNDLELVKKILFESLPEDRPNIHSRYYLADGYATIDSCLDIAVSNGSKELLKFFLEDKRICYEFDLTKKAHSLAHDCCRSGHLELLKYLTQNPLTKDFIHYKGDEVNLLTTAAHNNHVEVMDFLINSKEIPVNCFPNEDIWGVVHACAEGNVEAARLLGQYVEEKRFHYMDDLPFHNCYLKRSNIKHMQTLNYLIFELEIELTEKIKTLIKEDKVFIEKFKLRELNKTLNENLNKPENQKERKYKI